MFLILLLVVVASFAFGTEAEEELFVKIIKKPHNCIRVADPGDFLKVHYVGRLNDENGDKFDASRDRGHTFDFTLGAGQVIQGYEMAVPGMCLGETRVFVVPPHLGYGEAGHPPVIPPNSTLHFTVDLVEIIKASKDDDEL